MRRGMWLALGGVLAVVTALIVLRLASVEEADATTLGLVVVAVLLLLALGDPDETKKVLRRLSRISVAGVELGFSESERAERVERRLPAEQDEVEIEPRPKTGHRAGDYLKVRETLQKRLRFIRDVMFAGQFAPDYTDVVDVLRQRDLLDEDEVHLAYDLLGEDIAGWPDETRVGFLDGAWPFSYRLAASVWDRLVRQQLLENDWYIADFKQKGRHRPDFRATRTGEKPALIAARVARGKDIKLEKSRRRLAKAVDGVIPVVIVPEKNDYDPDAKYPEVEVLPLKDFLSRPRVDGGTSAGAAPGSQV